MNISLEMLIEMIKESTKTQEVHVPSTDYYARHGDSEVETLSYVCSRSLLEKLEELKENQDA